MRAYSRLNTLKGHMTAGAKLSSAFFKVHESVKKAITENKPVVALESTIITHGMEYPTNRDTALAVEENIIQNGAIPATIAIIDGVIHIGITKDQIEFLAKNKSSCRK